MGYKTPSLKQSYWFFFHPAPNNFLLIGNPNLKPETSHGFNASADYQVTKKFTASIAGYFNYVYDMIIDYISDENPGAAPGTSGETQSYIYTRGYENVGEAITTGGDLSLRYTGERLKLSGVYNLTIAKGYDEDEDAYVDLAGKVPHQVTLTAGYTIPVIETDVSLRSNWNAPRLHSIDEGHTPDYLMVSLRISKFFFGKKLEVYGGVQNLLNNIHFIEGTDGESQRDYFGLRDGIIFSLGGIFKW
jgi:outer membrane receptor for ferrienterochelin and colicins